MLIAAACLWHCCNSNAFCPRRPATFTTMLPRRGDAAKRSRFPCALALKNPPGSPSTNPESFRATPPPRLVAASRQSAVPQSGAKATRTPNAAALFPRPRTARSVWSAGVFTAAFVGREKLDERPPSPCPLPRGESESFAVFVKIHASGFATRAVEQPTGAAAVPSPRGRGLG